MKLKCAVMYEVIVLSMTPSMLYTLYLYYSILPVHAHMIFYLKNNSLSDDDRLNQPKKMESTENKKREKNKRFHCRLVARLKIEFRT